MPETVQIPVVIIYYLIVYGIAYTIGGEINTKVNPHHNGRRYAAIIFFICSWAPYALYAEKGLEHVIFAFALTGIPLCTIAYALGFVIRKFNMPSE